MVELLQQLTSRSPTKLQSVYHPEARVTVKVAQIMSLLDIAELLCTNLQSPA